MDIDTLLSKPGEHYRFHGVRGDILSELIGQSEDGKITLWGRTHDEEVDGEEYCEWVQGEGFLYACDVRGMELCYSNFIDEGGLVLVLEKHVDEPQEWYPRSDRREHLIRVEEWNVIGAVRPVAYDEDGDVTEEEAFSVEEIIAEEF